MTVFGTFPLIFPSVATEQTVYKVRPSMIVYYKCLFGRSNFVLFYIVGDELLT